MVRRTCGGGGGAGEGEKEDHNTIESNKGDLKMKAVAGKKGGGENGELVIKVSTRGKKNFILRGG